MTVVEDHLQRRCVLGPLVEGIPQAFRSSLVASSSLGVRRTCLMSVKSIGRPSFGPVRLPETGQCYVLSPLSCFGLGNVDQRFDPCPFEHPDFRNFVVRVSVAEQREKITHEL
jgi:hypothetical protein